MQIPGSLAKYRVALRWKQWYVAKLLDINQQAYSDLETGQTNLTEEMALKIAKLFEIDVMLIYRPNQPGNPLHTALDEMVEQLKERLKIKDDQLLAKDQVIKTKDEKEKLQDELLQRYREECEKLKEDLKREREKKRK